MPENDMLSHNKDQLYSISGSDPQLHCLEPVCWLYSLFAHKVVQVAIKPLKRHMKDFLGYL